MTDTLHECCLRAAEKTYWLQWLDGQVLSSVNCIPILAAAMEKLVREQAKAERVTAVREAAKHQLHLMFDIKTGSIAMANCACGVHFDATKPQCPQWEEHILALIDADSQTALARIVAEKVDTALEDAAIAIGSVYSGSDAYADGVLMAAQKRVRELKQAHNRTAVKPPHFNETEEEAVEWCRTAKPPTTGMFVRTLENMRTVENESVRQAETGEQPAELRRFCPGDHKS
jgi:hypothetical protein